jgi:hypothetical protein
MRGKKADPEFVSSFISQCVGRGVLTPEEIVKEAKIELQKIDDQIRAVEAIKINRSKLLDVIATFDKPKPKTEEVKLLSFFNLQYPQTCKLICQSVGNNYILEGLFSVDPSELKFCHKQLMEAKIITKSGSDLIRGEKFDEYMQFILGIML